MTTKSIEWFVKSCLADKGYAEKPLGSNNTKFGIRFGWNKVSWCCEYGWDKYEAAGVILPVKSASCVVIYDYCVKNGLHYNSTSGVPGDSVIRTWQGLSRNAKGFDPEQTHFQEVLQTEIRDGALWLGLWGGNQGAGYVGPAIEWVKAGDATILGGLAFSRLFTGVDVPPAAVKPVAPVHDKAKDAKSMPAAKSHPNIGKPATTEATNLAKRVKGKKITGTRRATFIRLRTRITRALKRGAK